MKGEGDKASLTKDEPSRAHASVRIEIDNIAKADDPSRDNKQEELEVILQ